MSEKNQIALDVVSNGRKVTIWAPEGTTPEQAKSAFDLSISECLDHVNRRVADKLQRQPT